MASHALNYDVAPASDTARVYSICFFDRGLVVPRVQLLEADTDEEAISAAQSMNRVLAWELWDRHRLVAAIPPGQ
jgi:hypothetical protein